MLLSKKVEVKLNSYNIKYYENKGYIIPRRIDNYGRYKFKRGSSILVDVKDLQHGSHTNVLVKCDKCKKEFNLEWRVYLRYLKDNGEYYCNTCAYKLVGKINEKKTRLENGVSFEQWCYDNLCRDDANNILSRWNYELNKCKPNEILHSTKYKYWFNCPNNKHKPENKSIKDFTSGKIKMQCNRCNSLAEYIIQNFGEKMLYKYWSNKNTISPWDVSKSSETRVYINCLEKDYHSHENLIKCSSFTNGGMKCKFCNYNGNGKIHKYDSLGYLYPISIEKWSNKNKKSPYEYSPYSVKEVWWKCQDKKHKDYKRRISSQTTYNFHCPECSRERMESYLQEKVNSYLILLGYDILNEYNCILKCINPKTNKRLPYDNEVKELKLIIEVHGEQHYKESTGKWFNKNFNYHKQKLYDRYKRMYAKSQGYEYLEIPYWTDDKSEKYKKLIDDKIKEIKLKNISKIA